MTRATFEYLSLIGQGSNQRSLMLLTSRVRLAPCTLELRSNIGIIQDYLSRVCNRNKNVPLCQNKLFGRKMNFGQIGQVLTGLENFRSSWKISNDEYK